MEQTTSSVSQRHVPPGYRGNTSWTRLSVGKQEMAFSVHFFFLSLENFASGECLCIPLCMPYSLRSCRLSTKGLEQCLWTWTQSHCSVIRWRLWQRWTKQAVMELEPSTVHPEDSVLMVALLSCVIFGKLLELSKSQFMHL